MIEAELSARLDHVGISPRLPERRALELRKIPEPADANRSDRFVLGIDDDVGRLPIVAVEYQGRAHSVFFKEADAAHRLRMQQLLVCRHDLATQGVVPPHRRVNHDSGPFGPRFD
jgi:hypothetical protein